MELQDTYNPVLYVQAAELLTKMGREDLGDKALLAQVQFLKNAGNAAMQHVMEEMFCQYALKTGKPEKAFEIAEQVLALKPSYMGALTVRLYRQNKEGQSEAALATAREIVRVDAGRNVSFSRQARDIVAGADTAQAAESTASSVAPE